MKRDNLIHVKIDSESLNILRAQAEKEYRTLSGHVLKVLHAHIAESKKEDSKNEK